jgi:hypothetical protein
MSSDAAPAHPTVRFGGPSIRTGAVIKSLLTTLCGAALLMTAAAVLDPATLQASSASTPRPALPRDAHQEFMRSLGSLVGQCERVLAIKPGEDDRGAELVLWLEDTHDSGRVNADELALLRHSPLFQTITFYTVSRHATALRQAAGDQPSWRGVIRSPSARASETANQGANSADSAAIDEFDVAAPGFIDRWRAMSVVQARVIATGVSDMQVRDESRNGESQDAANPHLSPLDVSTFASPQLSHLRLHLRWTSDSADGPDEASAVVSVQPSAFSDQSKADRRPLNADRRPPQQEYTP